MTLSGVLEKPAPHTQTSIGALLSRDAMMAPLGVKPKEAARLIGGSRSEVYRLLRQRRLRGVKRGATLLVLMDSIREHMASLPPARFGADRAEAAPE
jgi:excisionase family DNA binding protein